MKEYIDREELMDVREKAIWVYENANVLNVQTIRDNLKPLLDKVVDIPAADVVKVVRCENCTWYTPYEKPVEDFDGWCSARSCETDDKEFCSYSSNARDLL